MSNILTSPEGVSEYPYLSDPDIAFNPEGLFHTKLVCKKSESLKVKKAIDDLIAQEIKKQHDKITSSTKKLLKSKKRLTRRIPMKYLT